MKFIQTLFAAITLSSSVMADTQEFTTEFRLTVVSKNGTINYSTTESGNVALPAEFRNWECLTLKGHQINDKSQAGFLCQTGSKGSHAEIIIMAQCFSNQLDYDVSNSIITEYSNNITANLIAGCETKIKNPA